MKELSPVERCRKKGWKKGTVIKSSFLEWGDNEYEYWKITGFGEYEVLGRRVNLPPFVTCGEEVIPFFNRDSWRKSRAKI